MKKRVIFVNQTEFVEEIGRDGKKYIFRDTTGKVVPPYQTYQKLINWYKFNLIPYRTFTRTEKI